MNSSLPKRLSGSLLLLVLCINLRSVAEPERASPTAGGTRPVVCNLEQPVVGQQGRVTAQVLAEASNGTALQYSWSATGGAFVSGTSAHPVLSKQGHEATVQWDANGAATGSYTLTAEVTGGSRAASPCSLNVLVVKEHENRGEASVSGELGSEAERALLVKGRTEQKGYGLYSYILLPARPDAESTPRFVEVLKAYLSLEDINLETNFKLDQLNITYVPVMSAMPGKLDPLNILDNYDYSRARFLLASLPPAQLKGDGPFIVSSIQPLQGPGTKPEAYIVQNLSTVPVSVIPLWMRQFRSETTQQHVWEKNEIGTMALHLRTAVAIAAEGLPMVQKAVATFVVTSK